MYLFKVNNITLEKDATYIQLTIKLTIKTPERCQWRRSGIFIVNFFLVFLLLTLKK